MTKLTADEGYKILVNSTVHINGKPVGLKPLRCPDDIVEVWREVKFRFPMTTNDLIIRLESIRAYYEKHYSDYFDI